MRSSPKKPDVLHLALGTTPGLMVAGAVCTGVILTCSLGVALTAVAVLTVGIVAQNERRRI